LVRDRAETDEVNGRKANLLLVEKVTNLGTDVLPLVAKLVVVDWIEVLQATIRLWSLGHDEEILRRAVDQLGKGMGDPRIVDGSLDLRDNVGRGAGRDARGVCVVETEVGEVRVGGGEGRALAVLPG